MDDISIGLLKGIKKSFSSGVEDSKTINDLLKKLDDKKADYEDAQKYAIEVGELLSKSFEENIDSASLPNGKMYYNIAKKVVDPELKEGFEKVSDYSTKVQKILNEDAKIGLKVQKPVYNQARSNGIVRRLADADSYDDVSWILKDPVVNFHQSVVDDTIKVNAEAHYKVGMHPKITRKVAGKACDWCMNLAGTYEYPDDVPDEVYHRHRDCRCIVTYNPGNGKTVQDVHTKKWIKDEKEIELRKIMSEKHPSKPEEIRHIGNNTTVKNVTSEYYGLSYPGKGNIIKSDGYKISNHKDEIRFAEFIHKKFGGEIVLLNEGKEENSKNPDFLWNDKMWELKTLNSSKAVDTQLRKALKQIYKNPGGVFLDTRNIKNYNDDEFIKSINDRVTRSKLDLVDIMLVKHGDHIEVLRYKKKR